MPFEGVDVQIENVEIGTLEKVGPGLRGDSEVGNSHFNLVPSTSSLRRFTKDPATVSVRTLTGCHGPALLGAASAWIGMSVCNVQVEGLRRVRGIPQKPCPRVVGAHRNGAVTISQYFEKGFVYTWTAPGAVANQAKDGSIVASGNAAPPVMTFTGVHALPGAVLNPRINQGKLIRYHWLDYILGRTAYVAAPAADVLTGFMSGCWICSWTEGGQRRVGHVGTIDGVAPNVAPNTTVKHAFVASNALQPAANIRGYNPAAAWTPGEMAASFAGSQAVLGVKVMSLVTTNDHFYSILMLMLRGPTGGISNRWVCGGKKRVHASTRAAIQLAMT